jgi:hypothetical protein
MLWFDAQRNQKGVASLQRKIREKDLHSEGEQGRNRAVVWVAPISLFQTTVFEEFGMCIHDPFGYDEK